MLEKVTEETSRSRLGQVINSIGEIAVRNQERIQWLINCLAKGKGTEIASQSEVFEDKNNGTDTGSAGRNENSSSVGATPDSSHNGDGISDPRNDVPYTREASAQRDCSAVEQTECRNPSTNSPTASRDNAAETDSRWRQAIEGFEDGPGNGALYSAVKDQAGASGISFERASFELAKHFAGIMLQSSGAEWLSNVEAISKDASKLAALVLAELYLLNQNIQGN